MLTVVYLNRRRIRADFFSFFVLFSSSILSYTENHLLVFFYLRSKEIITNTNLKLCCFTNRPQNGKNLNMPTFQLNHLQNP